jgi:hypothetical protein
MAVKKKAVDALVDGQKRVAPEPSVPPKPPKPVQRLPAVHTDDAWDISQETLGDKFPPIATGPDFPLWQVGAFLFSCVDGSHAKLQGKAS